MASDRLNYWLIRTLTYPFGFLSYPWLRRWGRVLGSLAYYLLRDFRKRALSNVALATDLALDAKQVRRLAKLSFQNLAINCLEYPKLSREKNWHQVFHCVNPDIAGDLYKKGQGVIFFCGHLSNWEVLFLDGTSRMQGIAIGKSIKNKRLYKWILSIREKNGGKIVSPSNAIKEGIRALKKGHFIGIVGDQGMPNSGYSFPFLGRRAWTSTAPALLAYRTHSPIIFAETHRTNTGYEIRYAPPLWPDLSRPLEEEVTRLMDALLSMLQESIRKYPGEWLWQHNRWKQQTPQNLFKRFRQDCICAVLPRDPAAFAALLPHLTTLKTIYPRDFLFLLVPDSFRGAPLVEADEVTYYKDLAETLREDYRFKLIFDFANYPPLKRHYSRLSAFEVLDRPSLEALAAPHLPLDRGYTFSDVLKRALCRPGTLWN